MVTVPPTRASRSVIAARPKTVGAARVGVEADPVVGDGDRDAVAVANTLTTTDSGLGVLLDVEQRLAGGVGQRGDAGARAASGSSVSMIIRAGTPVRSWKARQCSRNATPRATSSGGALSTRSEPRNAADGLGGLLLEGAEPGPDLLVEPGSSPSRRMPARRVNSIAPTVSCSSRATRRRSSWTATSAACRARSATTWAAAVRVASCSSAWAVRSPNVVTPRFAP